MYQIYQMKNDVTSQNTSISPDHHRKTDSSSTKDSTGNSHQTAVDFSSGNHEIPQIQSLKVEDSQEETNSWWYHFCNSGGSVSHHRSVSQSRLHKNLSF